MCCSVTSFKPTFLLSSSDPQYELFCVSAQSHATQVSPSGRGGDCSFHMCGLLLLLVVEQKKASHMKWLWHTQYHTVAPCMWILSEATRAPRSKRIVTNSFTFSINGKMASEQDCAAGEPDLWSHKACKHNAARACKEEGWTRFLSVGIALLYMNVKLMNVKFMYSSIHTSLKNLNKSSPLQMFPWCPLKSLGCPSLACKVQGEYDPLFC